MADKQYFITSVNGKTPTNGNVTVNEFSGDYQDLTNKPNIPTHYMKKNNKSDNIIFGLDSGGLYCDDLIYPVGGTIFYIDSDNGNNYQFYDENMNELTDISVSGLTNAKYYFKSGNSSIDRFYVFSGNLLIGTAWGGRGTSLGATRSYLGGGKTNSKACLAALGDDTSSLWNYIKQQNENCTGDCSDWYVGSKDENEQLRLSGTTTTFSGCYVWSSTETSSSAAEAAMLWDRSQSAWMSYYKDVTGACTVPIRSF